MTRNTQETDNKDYEALSLHQENSGQTIDIINCQIDEMVAKSSCCAQHDNKICSHLVKNTE